jgi:hypothetical protein
VDSKEKLISKISETNWADIKPKTRYILCYNWSVLEILREKFDLWDGQTARIYFHIVLIPILTPNGCCKKAS